MPDVISATCLLILDSKLLLALAVTLLTVIIAAVNTPPAGGKSDILKTYRPAEASACNVG
jgi:hypothetical protein